MQEQVTKSNCKWCGHVIEQESPKKFFGGWRAAPYPEDWKQVEEEWICHICKLEYLKMLAELKNRRKGKQGR
jgi:rubredoxin